MKKILAILCLYSSIMCTDTSLDADHIHRYMWANYLDFSGKKTQANNWYTDLFDESMPLYARKGQLHHLFSTNQYAYIVKLIQALPQLETLFADDAQVQQIIALSLAQTGHLPEAEKRLLALQKKFKDNQEIAFNTAQIYVRKNDFKNALTVIDTFLNNAATKPNNFIFYFLKAQILINMGKYADARASIQKSLDLYPHFDKSWLLYAMMEEQTGKLDEAIKGYSKYLELTPNPQIQQHLLQLVFKQKMVANNKSSLVLDHECLKKALSLFEQKQFDKAIEEIDKCIKDLPKHEEARILKLQILGAQGKLTQAGQLAAQWIAQEPNNQTWYEALHILYRMGLSIANVEKALEKGSETNNLLPTLYLADVYLKENNQTKAEHYLSKALAHAQSADLVTKIRYQLGLLHYEQKEYHKMKRVLEPAMQQAQFAPGLNLLAYYYTKKAYNPAHAQKLLSLALQQDPENPHYRDTQAMIYLAQHQPQKALPILTQLAQQLPEDSTIAKHMKKAQTHQHCIAQRYP